MTEIKKQRKRPVGYYVLKDEVVAGLKARLDIVTEHFGGKWKMSKELKVSYQVVVEWHKRGRISAEGARKIHYHYKKNGNRGFRATYCRPDLEFDNNGKATTLRCKKRHMLRVVTEPKPHE